KLAYLRYECTGRSRPFDVSDADGMSEDLVGNAHVRGLARYVDDPDASDAHEITEGGRQHDTAEQNIECGHRAAGDNAIIHLHRKDDAGERKKVRDERSEYDAGVGAQILEQNLPQPIRSIGR